MDKNSKLTSDLQREIIKIAKVSGFSIKELARRIYTEMNAIDNQAEIQRFTETFQKQLKRPSTKPERLQNYLNAIASIPDIQKLGIIPNHIPHDGLGARNEIEKISKEIYDDLNSDELPN